MDDSLLVVADRPAAFAAEVMPGREVAARPDPIRRRLDHSAFGEPTVLRDPLDGRAEDRPQALHPFPPLSPVISVASNARATGSISGTYVADRIAPRKQVRKVGFVAQIPRSATGKVLRRLLLERDHQPA